MAAETSDLTTKDMAAVRKFIFELGDPDGEADDILEAAESAVERIKSIEETAENAETSAQSALGAVQARERADGGQTKKETVATKSRNELVLRSAKDATGSGKLITVRDVKDMCRPELTVYQQTVEDAWDELAARWSCFYRGSTTNGKKALKIDVNDIDGDVVHVVEQDLDRDDLSKRLLRRGGA